MRFLVVLLALTLPAFAQIRYSPTGFTAPFISTVTNQASAQAYLGISGGGGGSVTNFGGTATNLQVYSSGTTNRPLRVYGTNGSEFYINKDGWIVGGTGGPNGGSYYSQPYNSAGLELYYNSFFWTDQYGAIPFSWNRGGYNKLTVAQSAGIEFGYVGDVCLFRDAAGVASVTSGTAGTYRDLITRSTFATNASITNITADGYITTQQTLAYASGTNVTVDANKSLHFVSLTNTAYLAQPSNLGVGRSFSIILQQDGTGTRAVTFNTNYWKFPGGVVPTITTNANAYDVLSCISCPYGTNVFVVHNANFR